jgi:RNA polymerase sigma-70 factor (ECF subfamily)
MESISINSLTGLLVQSFFPIILAPKEYSWTRAASCLIATHNDRIANRLCRGVQMLCGSANKRVNKIVRIGILSVEGLDRRSLRESRYSLRSILGEAEFESFHKPLRFAGTTVVPVLLSTSATEHGDSRDRLEAEVVALFDRFRDRLLRYVSSFGFALPDAEEVIQEVFLSLFQHLQLGRSREKLPGWLFRVAHNLALKRRTRAQRDSEERVEASAEELAMDPGPNPEDQLVNSQTQRRLLAVVQALPEQDRRCLILRAEGLRYRGIAEVLDMSLGAVSMSLARSPARIARAAER